MERDLRPVAFFRPGMPVAEQDKLSIRDFSPQMERADVVQAKEAVAAKAETLPKASSAEAPVQLQKPPAKALQVPPASTDATKGTPPQ